MILSINYLYCCYYYYYYYSYYYYCYAQATGNVTSVRPSPTRYQVVITCDAYAATGKE